MLSDDDDHDDDADDDNGDAIRWTALGLSDIWTVYRILGSSVFFLVRFNFSF